MNKNYYNKLDENFEQACKLNEKDFIHEELIEMLKNGNIPEKQIAALKYDYVKNEEDAKILLKNLTGCDGKIREAVALRINQILTEDINSRQLFCQISAETLADASIDINGNICRLAVDSACMLKENQNFAEKYSSKLICFAKEALEELDKFIFRDKKYTINKQLFKLYWCLEGIKHFQEFIDRSELKQILAKCANQKEYTIREKTAQIVNLTDRFPELEPVLKNDENYYVRECFNKQSISS